MLQFPEDEQGNPHVTRLPEAYTADALGLTGGEGLSAGRALPGGAASRPQVPHQLGASRIRHQTAPSQMSTASTPTATGNPTTDSR